MTPAQVARQVAKLDALSSAATVEDAELVKRLCARIFELEDLLEKKREVILALRERLDRACKGCGE